VHATLEEEIFYPRLAVSSKSRNCSTRPRSSTRASRT
jgi:hypothetical protein